MDNRQRVIDELKTRLPDYVGRITTPSKGKGMYTCPLCGSGTGQHGTGAFSIKGDKWKCFSCTKSGDIFDLIGEHEHITDYNEQLKRGAAIYGMSIEYDEIDHTRRPQVENKPITDGTEDFFLKAHKNIGKTEYPAKRGIGAEIIERFNLGYVEEWRHPSAPANVPTSPRLIIPTGGGSYLARDTRPDLTDGQKEYAKQKTGNIQIFNAEAISSAASPVFIVEGEIDALSIIEVGGEAIALGTTTMAKAFLNKLDEGARPTQPLVIALDEDEAGRRASEELEEGFLKRGIKYFKASPHGKYKDPNEALVNDREAFKREVEKVKKLQEEIERRECEKYQRGSAANYLQDFVDGITANADTPAISTGFNALDMALGDSGEPGGFYEGLYIVGAISSLGKTTIMTQITDQIAQTGQDVLIFSLEMARNELIAKSISRHTLEIVLATNGDARDAKTYRGVTVGSRYERYSEAERQLIKNAILEYSKYADHIYIHEGQGDIGVENIKEAVSDHIRFTGNKPLVMVDYLQILAPYNERATDKQNTDKAVMELKRISRDFKIPVIGISSFNRASYKEAVTMEAFKESGAIEYSSDVLIGLQLKGAGGNKFDATEAKNKDPREVELVILKNRNGRAGNKVEYQFYPMFNYFAEC